MIRYLKRLSQARLEFVAAKGNVPEPGELRFDMFDAELTHVGDLCTFAVLIERMGLDDPALVAIGEIIHDLDLRDDKFGRDESAGVRGAIDGICTVARDDNQRIAAATPMLDGLHRTSDCVRAGIERRSRELRDRTGPDRSQIHLRRRSQAFTPCVSTR